MLQESNDNHNKNIIIGLKPEAIKYDIMKFKNDVLIDMKELKKNLEEKYITINSEIKENLELFNKKLLSFNSKLLELSSKIITDSNTKEKLLELLAFKNKSEKIMITNNSRMNILNEVTENRINYIEKLLKSSVFFPGLIGTNCKYKNMNEFIEFIFKEINVLIESKEKSLIDMGIYKTKMDNFVTSTKMKLDTIKNELIFFSSDKTEKSEGKIIKEIELRDEKIKDIRIGNQEYILNLEKSLKNFNEDVKTVKVLKESINEKFEQLEEKNMEKLNKIQEKYNEIENQINILEQNIKKSVYYLNRNGANIEINNVKKGKIYSGNNSGEEELEENKNDEAKRNINVFTYKKKNNNNEDEKELNEEEKNKNKIKYIKVKESEISKYIKGEITAEEIGKSANHRRRVFPSNRNFYEEHIIEKSEYIKSLTNKTSEENKKIDYIINNKRNSNHLINDYFYINHLKNNGNRSTLNTEKKMSRTLSVYENFIKNNYNDLDAKLHSESLAKNLIQKNAIDKNKNFVLKINKENNNIYKKNNLNTFNYTKILEPKKIQDYKSKKSNMFPLYKVLSLKDINENLSAFVMKNNVNSHKSLSPNVKQISGVMLEKGNNKNLNIFNNLPKSTRTKIKKKINNSDFVGDNTRKIKLNLNRTINSERNDNIS